GPHRYGRGRFDDDDFLDHYVSHAWADGKPRESLAAARPLHARPDHWWGHHLLVHRCFDAGGDDGCLPSRRVHQGQYQARGGWRPGFDRRHEESRRDLHEVCSVGDVQHLLDHLLFDVGLRLPRTLLLHWLPDLDRHRRSLSGPLHGERRWSVGQR